MREIRKITLDGDLFIVRPGVDVAIIGSVIMLGLKSRDIHDSGEACKTEAVHLHRFLGDHFSLRTLMEFARILKPMLNEEAKNGKAIPDE